MSWSITMVILATALAGNLSARATEQPAAAQPLQVNLRLLEGDPLGSVDAGTLKVLADTRVATLEHRSFTFHLGRECAVPSADRVQFIPVGRLVEGTARQLKDGKIRLDVTAADTTVAEPTGERFQLRSESTRTIATLRPGEVIKIRLGKGRADRQVWAELSIEVVGR